jgi:hypothetical protein
MASLNKIIYVLGEVLSDDISKYMSVNELSKYFSEEDNNKNRIRNQLKGNFRFFSLKKVGKGVYYRLNGNGKNYYDRIKDVYDINTDTMLINPIRIELI